MKKKILVLGGSGYIGTVLNKNLIKNNYEIINIDNLIYGGQDKNISYVKNSKYYHFYNFDVRNIKNAKFIPEKLEAIIVLCGLVGDPITKKYKKLSNSINRKGIIECINFFKNKKTRFIFVSTCSNYGLIKDPKKIANEKTELKPLSIYAKDKVFVEKFLQKRKKRLNFNYTILRFATAFGVSPRMRFDLSISDFAHQIYYKKKLEVYDPHTWRPYCHVEDISRAIIKIISSKKKLINKQIFNVGSDKNNYTKEKIVKDILKRKLKAKIHYLDKDKDPRNYRVNFAKISNKLNFKCKFSVSYGINEILKCFKKGMYKNRKNLGNYLITSK